MARKFIAAGNWKMNTTIEEGNYSRSSCHTLVSIEEKDQSQQ
jgi:triosephosphate isomerase